MKFITDDHCLEFAHPGHPERPERISTTVARLRSQTDLPLTWSTPGPVEEEVLLRAHSPDLLARLEEPRDFDVDTPFFPGIAGYARSSVGAALLAMRTARAGEAAFSLMRPPGHHATRNRAMGFCYLNNVAVCVLEALAAGVERVAVFDFDVHHANGTESLLLNKPGAALFSVHQFPCYPGTGLRNLGDNCFNYPFPPDVPRGEYRSILASALEQLQAFRPTLVGVSAGFDGYLHDPLAQGTLAIEDFNWLGSCLYQLGVPVFSVLEGGYSHDLPDLVLAFLHGLSGK